MTIRDNLILALNVLAPQYNAVVSENEKVAWLTNTVRFSVPDGEGIIISFDFGSNDDYDPNCETRYKAKGKEYTFDRLGVDASFYYEDLKSLPAQIEEQVKLARAAQARIASSTEFNMGPKKIMVTPERIKNIVDTLQAGKTYDLRPAGFGQGYSFSTKRRTQSWGHCAGASKELIDLVGAPIYVTSFDCD